MKLPIEVHNPLIPFKGFSWITWLAFAFTRKPKYQHLTDKTSRHEGIQRGNTITDTYIRLVEFEGIESPHMSEQSRRSPRLNFNEQ